MSGLSESEIKAAVKRHYTQLAKSEQSCCGPSCCATDESNVPREAVAISASCGSPVAHAALREGEVVVDLGSGGGIDVFRASKAVGDTGRVIGVDSTPEMLQRARGVAAKYEYRNVEFRQGEIEQLPVADNSVDVVISNCVLNLVPDKESAFREIYRVLKPGGKISVSDMVATQGGRKEIKPDEWAACIAGAVTVNEYKGILEKAGFTEIEGRDESHPINQEMESKRLSVKSMTWKATKPS